MGADDEGTWDGRVLAKIESGVDPTIIRENLRLTPTERLQKTLRTWALVEESVHIAQNEPRRA